MVNKPKAKGTAAETAVVRYLQSIGFASARRIVMEGNQTTADIWVSPWLVLQVKNYKTWSDADIDKWLDETELQGTHAGQFCYLIVKRPGKGNPENWWLFHRHQHGCVGQYRLGEVATTWKSVTGP